jgi:hypothetical protein
MNNQGFCIKDVRALNDLEFLFSGLKRIINEKRADCSSENKGV